MPGQRYRIRPAAQFTHCVSPASAGAGLHIAGKWRTVTWAKVQAEKSLQLDLGSQGGGAMPALKG